MRLLMNKPLLKSTIYERELLHNRDDIDLEITEDDDNDELKHLLNYSKIQLAEY